MLDLTEAMAAAAAAEPASSFRTIDAAADVVFTDRPPEPAPRVEEPPPQFTPPAARRSRADVGHDGRRGRQRVQFARAHRARQNARTLEDLVKEMLRPMLKGWLDDNLPGLVERIVRAEIERVSRGR